MSVANVMIYISISYTKILDNIILSHRRLELQTKMKTKGGGGRGCGGGGGVRGGGGGGGAACISIRTEEGLELSRLLFLCAYSCTNTITEYQISSY